MLELQKLRYFLAVAETLNVGRAAVKLHISQSPLSRQIIALEERLGTPLFTRDRKRLELTQAGRQLVGDAKALVAHAQRLEDRMREEAAGATGTLTVGFVEGAVHLGVLQSAIRRFLKAVPRARVELQNLRSRQQFEALEAGAIDVGFTYSPPPERAALVHAPMAEEGFLLAIPRNHPLSHGRLNLQKLDGEPFIALPERASPEARQMWLAACARAGFVPNVRFEASDPMVALGLVDAGVGLALVQESLRRVCAKGVVLRLVPRSFDLRVRIFSVAKVDARPLAARFLSTQPAR